MMISLKDIRKSYSNGRNSNREILTGINLDIEPGDTIAITGPSGTGKTTLLNIIGKMDQADSGDILFNNQQLSKLSADDTLKFRNQEVGFVFQKHHLLPQCTLLENILLPTIPFKQNNKDSQNKAEQIMKDLGIWELRDQKPSEMSIGECQRGAVARAIINDPNILLADEPTGALDSENAKNLGEIFSKLNKERGLTIIVVTHSNSFARNMKKIYRLEGGQLTLNQ